MGYYGCFPGGERESRVLKGQEWEWRDNIRVDVDIGVDTVADEFESELSTVYLFSILINTGTDQEPSKYGSEYSSKGTFMKNPQSLSQLGACLKKKVTLGIKIWMNFLEVFPPRTWKCRLNFKEMLPRLSSKNNCII